MSYVDKWLLENGMKRNHSQYQAMMMAYLRNGKRASTNHGVMDVRGRLPSTKEA